MPPASVLNRLARSPFSNACLVVLASLLLPGCFFITGDINPFAQKPQPLEERQVGGEGRAKIVVTDISRMISEQDEESAMGLGRRPSLVSRVQAELDLATKDPKVKAIVLRINTPGGTVTASDVLYQRLLRLKADKKIPVVAQFMDMATSGGYYVALAADEIVAHPTTVTGSIGVVLYAVSFEGLLDKIGVRNQTVKSGAKKDIGSPLRNMTEDEKQLMEGVLGEMKDRFVGLVRERRHLTPEAERIISDGRILTANQAKALGLVDRIGYLEDGIEQAKVRAGLSEARIVMYRRPDEYSETIYARAPAAAPVFNLINVDFGPYLRAPQFLYMWLPGEG